VKGVSITSHTFALSTFITLWRSQFIQHEGDRERNASKSHRGKKTETGGSGVRLPCKRTVRPKITFEPSQVAKILDALKEPHRTMVLLAAVTGMRASELFGLKWSDVDFERRLLFIRRTYYRGEFGLPKNETSERVIPLVQGCLRPCMLTSNMSDAVR
jgi:integrase